MAESLKLWKKLLLVVGAIIFLLIISISLLLFSRNPNFSKSELQAVDSIIGMRYVWQVIGAAQKAESPETLASVVIKSNDVMSLVRLLENGGDFLRIIGINSIKIDEKTFEMYNLNYLSDHFNLKVRLYEPVCGLTILAHTDIKLEYNEGKLIIDLDNVKIGRINLPASAVNTLEQSISYNIKNNSN